MLLLLATLPGVTGCLGTKPVLRFRAPNAAEPYTPAVSTAVPVAGQPRLVPHLARELDGVTADRVREGLLGAPHRIRAVRGNGEIWQYTFVRMPTGARLHHDARLIGRFPGDYPNLRVALVLFDNTVASAQIAWFADTVLATDVERLLGRPDLRETTGEGERFHYRYECFTGTERRSGAVAYTITDAVLTVDFSAEGNTGSVDLVVADQTRLTLFPDGRTEDPSTGLTWRMRPNLAGPGTTAARTPVDLITPDVLRVDTVGKVQATFGWPARTEQADSDDWPLTFAIYPIQRRDSVPGYLLVTYAHDGDRRERTAVRNLGLHWRGGAPSDPADLKLRLGTPDRVATSPSGSRDRWTYEYRIASPPPVTGTRRPLQLGLRVTFWIRNGVELLPTVDVERTSRIADTTLAGTGPE